MKVIIAGSRTITDYKDVEDAIKASGFNVTEVVSGMAQGVDRLGIEYAKIHNDIPVAEFPAAWKVDGQINKNAGRERNLKMAIYADALVAIWDGESNGTKHMIEAMKKINKPASVLIVKPKEFRIPYNADVADTIEAFVLKYKYRPLPEVISKTAREFYQNNLNGFGALQHRACTIGGNVVCSDYERVVIGDYGAYVEFTSEQLKVKLSVPEKQQWRFDKEFVAARGITLKYYWCEYNGVKVYRQIAPVKYADYKPNMFYISVCDFDKIQMPSNRYPKVLNKHKSGIPKDAVYIGRPSKWGNPFEIGKDGDREEVCKKYAEWILTQPELIEQAKAELKGKDLVCYCAPHACHGDTLIKLANGEPTSYRWARTGGYECSFKGDIRFSALFARLKDGRTVEEHYQCDVKGHNPGGTNWKDYKGTAPLDTSKDMVVEYQKLWDEWAEINPDLIEVLRYNADQHAGVLSDVFAWTDVTQANALAVILNRSAK